MISLRRHGSVHNIDMITNKEVQLKIEFANSRRFQPENDALWQVTQEPTGHSWETRQVAHWLAILRRWHHSKCLLIVGLEQLNVAEEKLAIGDEGQPLLLVGDHPDITAALSVICPTAATH